MSAVTQFLDAMRNAGIVPGDPADVVADGELHRFHIEGDKAGSHNGWAVLHLDGLPAGVFGNWKTGDVIRWHGGHKDSTPAERTKLYAQIEAALTARQKREHERNRHAQVNAGEIWDEAHEADPEHPYLKRKHVKPHSIREINAKLVIPMRDSTGVLWNVQLIHEDGTKRFLAGGRKRGLYFPIGGPIVTDLLIAEGYATGASLHEESGCPVAVAFDCGNLEPVARALRAKFPKVKITICADNDTHTKGNPGLTKANAAARAIDGLVAIPPAPFNDFNDAMVAL